MSTYHIDNQSTGEIYPQAQWATQPEARSEARRMGVASIVGNVARRLAVAAVAAAAIVGGVALINHGEKVTKSTEIEWNGANFNYDTPAAEARKEAQYSPGNVLKGAAGWAEGLAGVASIGGAGWVTYRYVLGGRRRRGA